MSAPSPPSQSLPETPPLPHRPHKLLRIPHRCHTDDVLHDTLKNWLAAKSKTPGSGYMSQAVPPGSLPTRDRAPGPPATCTRREWIQGTSHSHSPCSPTKPVRNGFNPHRIPTVLTKTTNRRIAERIPFEILCMIAGELEDPPRDDLPITVSKHQKNQRLISMRSVCKSWKEQLLRSKLLWQDVCFDTTRRGTIKMAESFLDLLEGSSFDVYATSSPGDLAGDTGVQLMARDLLLRLRQRIQDIRHCGFHTPSKEFRAHLGLPSSKVSYLNLGSTRESGTFSGDFPVLRELYIPASFFSSVEASTFPTLTTLSLCAKDTPTSLLWMLRLLRGAPRLTTLLLEGFTNFDIDCGSEVAPKLIGLKTLALTRCDFRAILSCMVAPNIHHCRIHGYISPRHEPTSIYQFLASPPPTSTTTTPDRQGPPSLHISIVNETITTFYMDLIDGDHKFTLSSTWTQPPDVWQSWTEQFLAVLSARFRPLMGIRLSLSFTGPIPKPLYSPLLRLPHVTDLLIRSSSSVLTEILGSLMALDEESTPVSLPTLRSLVIDGVSSFTNDDIDVVKAYMSFRSSRGLPFTFWSKDCDISWWPRGPFGFLGI